MPKCVISSLFGCAKASFCKSYSGALGFCLTPSSMSVRLLDQISSRMEDDHEASDTEFLLRLNSAARLADGVGPGPKNNCCWFNKRELMRFGVVWTLGSLFFLAFVGMVVLRASTLPNPVDDQQEGVFSEQRAARHLYHFVNEIGSRPIGSPQNKNATVQFILDELTKIQQASQAKFGYERIYFELRKIPGNDKQHGYYWDSIDNIAAVIHPTNTSANYSTLLISAHYDTVPFSAGAYDDTLGSATLLELANVLSNDEPLIHELMLLWNNGEEVALLGSKAFANWDPAFGNVQGFLNMDNTPGRKSVMFRSSGSAMDTGYKSVPRPVATIVSADIFKTGIVRSDTDFTIYSQQVSGLDFATYERRQAYHSIHDNFTTPGSLQFVGDNMLALIREFAMDPNFPDLSETLQDNVYFSVMEAFFVVYSKTVSFIIHLLVTLVFTVAFPLLLLYRYNVWKHSLVETTEPGPIVSTIKAFFKLWLMVICGIAFGTICGLLLRFYNATFYYNNGSLALFTFLFPTLTGMFAIDWVFAKREQRVDIAVEVAQKFRLWGVGAFWLFLMVVTTPIAWFIGSTYLIFWFGLCALLGVAVHHLAHVFKWLGAIDERRSIHNVRISVKRYAAWVLILFCMSFIPTVLLSTVGYMLIQFVIADMSAVIGGPIISFVVALNAVNFVPIARRGSNYGLLVTILLICTGSLFLAASLAKPFNYDYPYKIYTWQTVSYDRYMNITQSEITLFVGDQYSLTIEKFYNQHLAEIWNATCDAVHNNCLLTDYTPLSLPEGGPLNATLTSNAADPGSRNLTVVVHSPESYFHTLSIVSTGTLSFVAVNGQVIDPSNYYSFTYFLTGNDLSVTAPADWTITVGVTGANAEASKVGITFSSRYESVKHSTSLQKLINMMPRWVAITGNAHMGTIIVNTEWEF